MKDLRAVIRIKNNYLISFRESLGLTQEEIAKKFKVSFTKWNAYENLREYPISRKTTGEILGWNSFAVKISKAMNKEPRDIFPEAFQFIEKNITSFEIDSDIYLSLQANENKNIFLLDSPDKILEEDDLKNTVREVLETLNPREREVLERRYGFNGEAESLDAVGLAIPKFHKNGKLIKNSFITRERIRQIEAKALRKLRHPARANKLKEVMEK